VGLTKKTLLLAIKSLEEKNSIFTERRRSVERGDEPTSYRLNIADSSLREKATPPMGEKLPHTRYRRKYRKKNRFRSFEYSKEHPLKY